MLEAEDGELGWELLVADDSIQLVISDIEMPSLDGFELLDRIRQSEDTRLQKIPVIFITGAEDDETKQAALDAGATDFVVKPVDKVQLLARTRAQVTLDQTSRDLHQATSTLEQEAALDLQTGLTSRRYFMQRCNQDISAAMRHQEPMALLRINMDKYKKVYAEAGDDGFEDLLKWLANILIQTARTEDTVSRISGAEFAILAPKTDPEGALKLGSRLLDAVTVKPFTSAGAAIKVALSIGIVNVGLDEEIEPQGILALAEQRVETVRSSGGNGVFDGKSSIGGKTTVDKAPAGEAATEVNGTANDPGNFASGIYIDQALELLARNETEEIEPYLTDLLLQVLPLLEHANSTLNLNLGFAMNAMRERLEAMIADKRMAQNSSNQ
jgi:two-component system cell cycle response regulator